MQAITKNKIIAGLIALIVLFCLYIYFFTPLVQSWSKKDEPISLDYSAMYKNTKYRLDQSEKLRVQLKDSLIGAQTEKGFIEIQLNKARRELDEKRTDYGTARQKKDTTGALRICDSIVYNVIPVYWDLDSTRQQAQGKVDVASDSLLRITEQQSAAKDTVIAAGNSEIKRLKKSKRNLWVALGAAVAAFVALVVK